MACWCSCRRRWKKVGSYSSLDSALSSNIGVPDERDPWLFCFPISLRTSANKARNEVAESASPDPAPLSVSSRRVTAPATAAIASECDLGSATRAWRSSRFMLHRNAEESAAEVGGGDGSSVTRMQMVEKKHSARATAWSGSCILGGFTHPLLGPYELGLPPPEATLPVGERPLPRRSGSHRYPSRLKRLRRRANTLLAPRPTLKPAAENWTMARSRSRKDRQRGELP